MHLSPASHAEQIAHHRERLSLHEIDLPISSRIAHETALAELLAVDPFAVERAEVEAKIAQTRGAERALWEEALVKVKRAQGDHAGALILKGLPPAAHRFWSSVHRSAVVGPDVTDDDGRAFVREFGTIGLSEHEPSAEDRIVADIAGAPLPPAAIEVDAEKIREAQTRTFHAAEHAEKVALAGDHTRAEAEAWLGEVELEAADSTGALRFPLSDAQRAAAALLAEDIEDRATLARLRREVAESGARLDEIAEKSRTVHLAENGPIYEATDSHGARLLCLDDSIFNTHNS